MRLFAVSPEKGWRAPQTDHTPAETNIAQQSPVHPLREAERCGVSGMSLVTPEKQLSKSALLFRIKTAFVESYLRRSIL
jgi:hypothetical protein